MSCLIQLNTILQMTSDKEEVQKQHEAAKDYIIRLKEEMAAAKEIMNSAMQVKCFPYYIVCKIE